MVATFIVYALIVGTLIVGTLVVGILIVGTPIVGTFVVFGSLILFKVRAALTLASNAGLHRDMEATCS
jgi:hypothetical protein